jgi:alkylated DNA repair dioxygenase AlkB
MPAFLLSLRRQAAEFAGMTAEQFQQALVTEYRPGAAIRLAQGPLGL